MKKSLHLRAPRKVKKGKKVTGKKPVSVKPVEWVKAKISYAHCSSLIDAALETRHILKNEEVLSKLTTDDIKKLTLLMRELLNHCEIYRLSLDEIYAQHADKTARDDKVTQMFDMIDINVKYQDWANSWTDNVANKTLHDILTLATQEPTHDAA